MGLVSEGISCVRAFELPAGVWADGEITAGPRVCLVKWRSTWTDKLHQAYVNGKFAGATIDCEQRQLVVQTPSCFDKAVRIEVFAIEPNEADIDFSHTLEQSEFDSGRVRLSLLRSQRLPVGARYEVYFNGGSGEVDYDNRIGDGIIWACRQDKGGFGLARFAEGDFGYEWAAGIGFGKGYFRSGEFGVDADVIEWVSPALEAGNYKFGVKVIDEAGNESEGRETEEITVIPSARPAEGLNVMSFDKETNALVIEVCRKQ